MVSISDHDRIVSFIERLKYSLNNQKPPSFTCENSRLPAPTERTIMLGSTCIRYINSKMMPSAVSPATEADPRQTWMIASSNQCNTYDRTSYPCNIPPISLHARQ